METVVKAGVNTDAQRAAIVDSDDPFKDLQEGLVALQAADPSMVPEDLQLRNLSTYKDVITTAPVDTDDDILAQFQQQETSDEEDECEEVNGIAPQRPSRSMVENARLETLTNAALYSNTGDDMQT